MSDPIAPPAARWPLEAAELVALAMSDGDLGAAVAQYEPGALLRPWAGDRADGGTVRETMASIMQLRLPLDTRLVAVLPAEGLAMLVCERRIDGIGPGRTAGPAARDRLHRRPAAARRQLADRGRRVAAFRSAGRLIPDRARESALVSALGTGHNGRHDHDGAVLDTREH